MPNQYEPLQHHRRRPRAIAIASEAPVETAFDRAVNWLAAHPRITCVLVCALALVPLMMDAPR